MVYIYSGIAVGMIALGVGIISVSLFLIVLGSITSAGSVGLAVYFIRRRNEGYHVP